MDKYQTAALVVAAMQYAATIKRRKEATGRERVIAALISVAIDKPLYVDALDTIEEIHDKLSGDASPSALELKERMGLYTVN